MIEIKKLKECEIKKAALYISEINSKKEQHIGYCGIESDEIEASIRDIWIGEDNRYNFTAAYDNDCICGLIGFEADEDSGTAEIWGPFVSAYEWTSIADMLWNDILKIMPEFISRLHIFCDYYNFRCIDFAVKYGFTFDSEWYILSYNKNKQLLKHNSHIEVLNQKHYHEFEILHDTIFPNTYYSGKQIIEKIDKENQVFIAIDEGKAAGYIFVEANTEFNEGNIEFLGVSSQYRGKGYGESLVIEALRWLTEYKNIGNIALSVNSNNMAAINIYKKAGFFEDSHMVFYKKILR